MNTTWTTEEQGEAGQTEKAKSERRREEKEFEQRSCKWEKKKEGRGGGFCCGEKVTETVCVEVSVCVTQFELIVPDSLWGCLCQSLKPFLILPLHIQFSDPSF